MPQILAAVHDFLDGLALGGAPGHIGLGAGVAGHAGHDDLPQRGVGLAVPAAVEAVADLFAGGGVYRAGAAQRGEACLGAQPAGVVADGDQQRAGGLGGGAFLGQELAGGGVGDQLGERGVQLGDRQRGKGWPRRPGRADRALLGHRGQAPIRSRFVPACGLRVLPSAPAGDSDTRHARAVSFCQGQTGADGRTRSASPSSAVDHQRTTLGISTTSPHPKPSSLKCFLSRDK